MITFTTMWIMNGEEEVYTPQTKRLVKNVAEIHTRNSNSFHSHLKISKPSSVFCIFPSLLHLYYQDKKEKKIKEHVYLWEIYLDKTEVYIVEIEITNLNYWNVHCNPLMGQNSALVLKTNSLKQNRSYLKCQCSYSSHE